MKQRWEALKVWVRVWWRRNIADDDPYEANAYPIHMRGQKLDVLPSSALFIINGTLTDREGLRMIAHHMMLSSKTRRQTWN